MTKQISATTRTVLDSIRTFVIWIFSLAVTWETFSWIQLSGFVVLIIGMFLYNNVIIRPMMVRYKILKSESTETLNERVSRIEDREVDDVTSSNYPSEQIIH